VALHGDSSTVICSNCLNWLTVKLARERAGRSGGWVTTSHDPIFVVTDMSRSRNHYTKMGFTITAHDETYAFAERDGLLSIHLALANDDRPAPATLYLHCDDADVVAREWRLAGLHVDDPTDMDYGRREGAHTDPDGNVIRFGSPIPPSD
jgi:glyoxalase/bleomycin resistance protein/dioxygenase superfamily protein